MKNITAFLLMFLVSISFIACAQTDKTKTMSVEELNSQLDSDKDVIILDVRTAQELEGPLGHIDGVIHIPIQQLEKRVDELKKYKDKEIAVICRTGNRSGAGTSILIENGYNAKNVLGGMTEYRRKGY